VTGKVTGGVPGAEARTVPGVEGAPPPGSLTSHYDYHLPPDRIAHYPTDRRDASRLLEVPPAGSPRHRVFREVVELFREGDVLVLNESRVLPARLLGSKPSGAAAEVLLVRPAHVGPGSGVEGRRDPTDATLWEALVRPGGKLKPGRRVDIAPELVVEIVDSTGDGGRIVRLVTSLPVAEALARFGQVPLPPYLERPAEALDRERYQTVYARTPGSVAAPTAGLHFTPELLAAVEARGVALARVTLHVGIGTFRPLEVEDPALHDMHREWWEVTPEAAALVNAARDRGGRVWAVGTTAVRTLESAAARAGDDHARAGALLPGSGDTGLFIRPGYTFRVVDGLITNFHLPRSTLLMLVAAMAGYERIMEMYAEAIREGYRFYSYGDAMVIPPGGP
jgi:S-adenosylmethionine:tRNA ribosyltransferase-isomerase